MIKYDRPLQKNFEFLNFEFSYQSYGVFRFYCFLMLGLAKIQFCDFFTSTSLGYLYIFLINDERPTN